MLKRRIVIIGNGIAGFSATSAARRLMEDAEIVMIAGEKGPLYLAGKVAIVTGAARGIGKAVCVALAHEGAEVAAVDVMSVEEKALAVRELRRRALELKCDIAVPAQIKEGLLPIQQKN